MRSARHAERQTTISRSHRERAQNQKITKQVRLETVPREAISACDADGANLHPVGNAAALSRTA